MRRVVSAEYARAVLVDPGALIHGVSQRLAHVKNRNCAEEGFAKLCLNKKKWQLNRPATEASPYHFTSTTVDVRSPHLNAVEGRFEFLN